MSEVVDSPVYVVAVSGGVDSVVLLHMLVNSEIRLLNSSFRLVVAHFDHGIRPDSHEDAELVESLAAQYELEFVLGKGKLGSDASEATAREARYQFLHEVRDTYGAEAVVLAHHEDDVIETAVHNLLRGTGRKGLTSLSSTSDYIRPLLDTPKTHLVAYAKANNLRWHEDSTNRDTKYTRNYIRHIVLPKLYDTDRTARDQLRSIIAVMRDLNHSIDDCLEDMIELLKTGEQDSYDRHAFRTLPDEVQREVLLAILRAHNARDVDRKSIDRLLYGIMQLPSRKIMNVCHHIDLKVWRDSIQIVDRGSETV